MTVTAQVQVQAAMIAPVILVQAQAILVVLVAVTSFIPVIDVI